MHLLSMKSHHMEYSSLFYLQPSLGVMLSNSQTWSHGHSNSHIKQKRVKMQVAGGK